uniref:Mcm10 domain-containing protein n=1 Tax=Parastrongyloides trichosuri TaxID=131310 RepID=A0A0N4ZY19_PARTI
MSRKPLTPAQLVAMMKADEANESRKRPAPSNNIPKKEPRMSKPSLSNGLLGGKNFSNDEIRALLNKKSSHEDEIRKAEKEKEEKYFNMMEKREIVEEYSTNLMEIKNVRIFTCLECKITYHRKNPICVERGHTIREEKGTRRFFKCKDCSRRTISYYIYPKVMCTGCKGRNFIRVAMKDERIVKDKEELLLRGVEQKFVNR